VSKYETVYKEMREYIMRKSERINDMMIFLNGQTYFNLREIMEKYHISKSTALRDIQSLEEIGMPIYSEVGRNGRYGILKNRLLSPIVFTIDEMYALYFAMMTLKAYQSTPFHLSLSNLKKKFEICISDTVIDSIKKMEHVLSLESSQHYNSSPLLKEILDSAIHDKVCTITYIKRGNDKVFYVQFFDISSAYGQWYATAYNHETKRAQVFRCDKIETLEENNAYAPKPLKDLIKQYSSIYKFEGETDFEVSISKKGADLFYKENYPSMQLSYENQTYIIKGFYNIGEEEFIADYFIAYGNTVLSITPLKLKTLIINRLSNISEYYKVL
jgi:predicted DNA-binding transcriptional regulator YafY